MEKKSIFAGLDRFLSRQWDSQYFTYRQIFSMWLPMILDSYFVMGISLLTTAMISSSSQESLSAVSLVGPLNFLVFSFFSAASSGGAVLIAQFKGAGDMAQMRRYGGQIIFFNAVFSIILCGGMAVFAAPIVRIMFASASPVVMERAAFYLTGMCISQIFLAIYHGAYAIFRGLGETKVALAMSVVINVIHLIASFIFINIMHLDIMGTALSFNIARVIGALLGLYYLLFSKKAPGIRWSDIWRVDWHEQKTIFRISLPFALEQVFLYGGGILTSMFIVKLGTEAVAANAIANSSISMYYCLANAVGSLTITVVGQCIGAGDRERATFYGKRLMILSEISLLVSIAVFFPLNDYILWLYSAPTETMALIRSLMIIAIIGAPFFWVGSNALPSVLRAAGDVSFTSYASLGTMWLVRVGAAYVASIIMGLGIKGVWYCVVLEWIVRSIIFLYRYRSGAWLEKGLLGKTKE